MAIRDPRATEREREHRDVRVSRHAIIPAFMQGERWCHKKRLWNVQAALVFVDSSDGTFLGRRSTELPRPPQKDFDGD